jgi:magnesium-transporting ATPase (P-type)
MTLAAIVFCQIGMVLNCRTENQSVFKVGIFSNKQILFGIAIEILLISAVIYVPFLQEIFSTAPIGWKDWAALIVIPIPVVLLEEMRKAIYNKMRKNKRVGGQ